MILTERLYRSLSQTDIRPIIVLQIEGVPFLIGSDTIKRFPRYGDENLNYGDPGLFYGKMVPLPNQEKILMIDGTTTQIKQSLEPDKGRGSSVSQMRVRLLDKNGVGTKLLSGEWGEILYKRVKVWVSFGEDVAWNDDFILVFRGIIESIQSEQGSVSLMLNSPDQKNRSDLWQKPDTDLDGNINNSVTTLNLQSTEGFFLPPVHPSYSGRDPALKCFVKIDDEIIQYEGISGNSLTNLTRGALGTTAVLHDDGAQSEGFLVLEGNAMDLALKIMLSNEGMESYLTLSAASVNFDGLTAQGNIFFFPDINISREHNVQIGDFVKTSGFSQSANNFSDWKEVTGFSINDLGSTITVDHATVTEFDSNGQVEFLSKYNSLGQLGSNLIPDEVDIARHERFKFSFLNNFQTLFYLRDDVSSAKEFIEQELYLPTTCYSLPMDRDGLSRISLGIHRPPIPGSGIVTINNRNISNPDRLAIKRSINKNYYNAIVYKFEDQPLDEELRRRRITLSGTQAVPTGNKTLVIESLGMRSVFGATALADQAGSKLLERYESAAEYLDSVSVLFRDAIKITVGDILVLDPDGLNLLDSESATRSKSPLLLECVNRDVDIKNGSVRLDLVSTAFNIDARYGLISPASKITKVINQTTFVIGPPYAPGPFGLSEFRKWISLNQPGVRVRRKNFTFSFNTVLNNVSSNTVTIQTTPDFTVQIGDIIEFSSYNISSVKDQQKLIYAFLSDGTNDFVDGGKPYVYI
jgi:hypothetical protein